MTDARLLQPDELERAGCFWVEVMTSGCKAFLMRPHVVDSVDGDKVHMTFSFAMTCAVGKVVGQLTNYNIGWRAWLMKPTDAIRKAAKWDEVVQCDGVGYGWDCDYCEKECVHKCQTKS